MDPNSFVDTGLHHGIFEHRLCTSGRIFFIELTFDSGAPTPFKFSTEVSIVPNVIPYKFEDAAAKYPLKAQP